MNAIRNFGIIAILMALGFILQDLKNKELLAIKLPQFKLHSEKGMGMMEVSP